MLLAGLVAGLIIAFPSPGKEKEAAMTTIPGDVVKQEKARPFAPRKNTVLNVARKFVLTAVTRKHTAASWDLAAPSLRQGYTKKTWARGDIPVPPYPVLFGKWRIGYSYANEVDLQVALFARKKTKLNPVVFDVTLKRFRLNGHERWLVSSFLPAVSGTGDYESAASKGRPPVVFGTTKRVPGPRHTSATWLLLPAAIVGLVLLVLGIVGFRGWRSSRLYRAYFRERQISSSRPS